MSLCQLVLVGEEGALRVQYVLERRKALLIEVKGKIQGLFSLVYHFPEGYDLLDRVLVRAHGVIHFLYGGKHGLVELPDRLVQLAFANRVACIFWVPWKKFHVRVGAIS